MIRINFLPKTYDEIPIYQQLIEELKEDIPRMEVKLPLINEEVALLLRYEIEIDPKVGFFRDIQFEFLWFVKGFRTTSIIISSLGEL